MKLKKIGCIFMIFCMLVSLSACYGETISTIIPENPSRNNDENGGSVIELMIRDKRLENEVAGKRVGESTPIFVEWQTIHLAEEDSKKYPNLADTFEKTSARVKTDFENLMDDFVLQAQDANNEDYTIMAFESDSNLYVQRADSNIVSYVEHSYMYTGGAHGNTGWSGGNYNPETGKEIALSELITDMDALQPIVISELKEKYDENVFFFELDESTAGTHPEELVWSVDYEGMNIWFSPYVIASYAAGTLMVKLNFDEYPKLFNEKYTQAPSDYILEIPMHNELDFDLVDSDGKTDVICAYSQYDASGEKGVFSLKINDLEYKDNLNFGDKFRTYFVRKNGKSYIYTETLSDGSAISVYDINGSEVRRIDRIPKVCFYYKHDTYDMLYSVPNNIDKIKVSTGNDGYIEIYKVNDDGRFVKADK